MNEIHFEGKLTRDFQVHLDEESCVNVFIRSIPLTDICLKFPYIEE